MYLHSNLSRFGTLRVYIWDLVGIWCVCDEQWVVCVLMWNIIRWLYQSTLRCCCAHSFLWRLCNWRISIPLKCTNTYRCRFNDVSFVVGSGRAVVSWAQGPSHAIEVGSARRTCTQKHIGAYCHHALFFVAQGVGICTAMKEQFPVSPLAKPMVKWQDQALGPYYSDSCERHLFNVWWFRFSGLEIPWNDVALWVI